MKWTMGIKNKFICFQYMYISWICSYVGLLSANINGYKKQRNEIKRKRQGSLRNKKADLE